jgi:hypothetical protein
VKHWAGGLASKILANRLIPQKIIRQFFSFHHFGTLVNKNPRHLLAEIQELIW